MRFFEEFLRASEGLNAPKHMGIRRVESNPDDRPLCHAGKREFVLTEPITLQKGHKTVVYKASPKKPLRVITFLEIFHGEHNAHVTREDLREEVKNKQ